MMFFTLALSLMGCGQPASGPQSTSAHAKANPAMAQPQDGNIANCASGCSGPDTAHTWLGDDAIVDLLKTVAHEAVGEASISVETLLFHGAETLDVMARLGTQGLSKAHETWLRTELARDELHLQIRMVDGDGKVLGSRQDTIPIAQKQHLVLRETGALGRLSVNGKAKRVGVKHLWARF